MTRHVPPHVHLVLLGAILVSGAFHWGRATASGEGRDRRRTPVVQAVEHAAPAVVSVTADLGRGGLGVGAGVIVHPDGYVVTSAHVIAGGQSVSVQPYQQRQRLRARVVANDPARDLALLQIEEGRRWQYVSLRASAEVLLGETAIAVGNPHGLGDTITVGVVSAKGRSAKVANGATLRNLIQTDASINTGNSGGPLLNLDGELIGINASILPRAAGIAFSIPADEVRDLLAQALRRSPPAPNPVPTPEPVRAPDRPDPDLLARQRPPARPAPERAPAVSVAPPLVREAPPPVAAAVPDEGAPAPREVLEFEPLRPSDLGFEVRDDGSRLVVVHARAGRPAALAGLEVGDVLLDVDGTPVESPDDLVISLATSYPGRRFFVTVRRAQQTRNLVITVPRQPG